MIINELQYIIILWIIKNSKTDIEIVRKIQDVFTVSVICDMLGWDRNKYYYEIKKDVLGVYNLIIDNVIEWDLQHKREVMKHG